MCRAKGASAEYKAVTPRSLSFLPPFGQMDWVVADVTDLASIEDETFDLVYTGGHVAVRLCCDGGAGGAEFGHTHPAPFCDRAPSLDTPSNVATSPCCCCCLDLGV